MKSFLSDHKYYHILAYNEPLKDFVPSLCLLSLDMLKLYASKYNLCPVLGINVILVCLYECQREGHREKEGLFGSTLTVESYNFNY